MRLPEKGLGVIYEFPCGCRFPVLEENPPPGVIPHLDYRYDEVPDDCPAVWDLIASGRTKGIWQVESNFGRKWSKKATPRSFLQVGALGAILRPGCVNATDDAGVSMADHYCLRQNGREEVPPYHPTVDPVLAPTYGCLIYQESAMTLTRAVAGFDLQQADMLRRAAGKKDAQEMARVKAMFLEGAASEGILTEAQAEEVFGWIEKSQRYAFNKAHSFTYGLLTYVTAYLKAHMPLQFFASWIRHTKGKPKPFEEVAEMADDAKLFDVQICLPDLRDMRSLAYTDRKVVKFGLSHVRGIGESHAERMREASVGLDLGRLDWFGLVTRFASQIPPSVFRLLIESGALDYFGRQRQELLAEWDVYADLRDGEAEWVSLHSNEYEGLIPCLRGLARTKKEGGGCHTRKRVQELSGMLDLIEDPPSPRIDTPLWLAYTEEHLLGAPISCTRVDACDLGQVNVSCKEFLAGRTGFLVFGVEIRRVGEYRTRNGENPGQLMAFLTVADSTCALDSVVCFPQIYDQFKSLLTQGNTVILQGERGERDRNSLIIRRVWQAA